jgi:hypothetical protein
MPGPTFDESGWPILVATYAQTMTREEGEAFYAALHAYLERNQRFGVLLDARPADIPTATERARIVRFMKETSATSARLTAGIAVVMKTTGGRGVLTAVLWLYAPPFPIRAFSTLADGRRWLRERLDEHGT